MQALGLVWGDVDVTAPDYRERSIALDAPSHPSAQLTLKVWQTCAQRGGMVVGRDLPSRSLSSVLRNMAVYEPVADARDWRVRIAGTAFFRRFGRETTGAQFSDLFNRTGFEARRAVLERVASSKVPVFGEIERTHGNRAPVRFEFLLLPVLSPNRNSVWVAVGLFFHDWMH